MRSCLSPGGRSGTLVASIVSSLVVAAASLAQEGPPAVPENETQLDPESWLLPVPEGVARGAELPKGLLYERWNGVKGQTVAEMLASPVTHQAPAVRGVAPVTELPAGDGKDFGIRLRGEFVAPRSGTVKFVISSDDNAELWMSPNDSPFNRKKIAWITGPGWFGSMPPAHTGRINSQWSAPITLVAGQSYYVEAYHKESAGDDHFELMWQFEGEKQPSLVPADAFRPWMGSEEDADDDGLPDEWQVAKGLAGRPDAAWWQDADGDHVNNFEEFTGNTDPLDGSSMNGFTLLEIWWGSWGRDVADLKRDPRFLKAPHKAVFVAGAAVPKLEASHFGSRLSGYLVPTESGTYQLAVAGDDTVELWFSTDASKFNKKRVAFNDYWRGGNAEKEWKGVPAQQTSPIELVAGEQYYFEVIQKDAIQPGWSALGWKKSGEENFKAVTPEFLRSPAPEEADTDDDGLPDDWETDAELLAGEGKPRLTEAGDPDGDGLSTLLEYQLGTDPYTRTAVPGALAREWWFQTPGVSLQRSREAGAFLKPPSMFTLTNGAVSEINTVDYFTSRLRGTVKAPVKGEYRFWIAGDDQCELWLSDSARKFEKRKIAWILPAVWERPETDAWTPPQAWDERSTQESGIIEMEAGEERFLEILHKEAGDKDHVAVAWQYREEGGQWSERMVIPPAALASYGGDDDDLDDDYLPDAWEKQYGLDATDNGSKDKAKQGEDGDFDSDRLTNREEYLLGTNPTLADSDGDGVNDSDEIHVYGSNPKVRDAVPPVLYANLSLEAFQAPLGTWLVGGDGLLTSVLRRGPVEFSFETTEPGVYVVELGAKALSSSSYVPPVPVIASVDGKEIGRGEAKAEETNLSWMTQWLAPGLHHVVIDNRNVRIDAQLGISSVRLLKLAGDDLNGNGLPDWMEKLFRDRNGLDAGNGGGVVTSPVSPACLEGFARLAGGVEVGVADTSLTVLPGVSNHWYSNVPLQEEGDTPVNVAFEGGALTQSVSLRWDAMDPFSAPEEFILRTGDKLKLAVPGSGAQQESVTCRITVDGNEIYAGPAGHQAIASFPEEGEHLVETSLTGLGQNSVHSFTVIARSGDFGAKFHLAAGEPRTWTLPDVSPSLALDNEPLLSVTDAANPPANGKKVRATWTSTRTGSTQVLARLAPGGPVVAGTAVNVFRLVDAAESGDAKVVKILPDGTRVVEMAYLIDGEIPADFSFWIDFYVTDAVFVDGSTRYHLTAADFDENGMARVKIYKAPGEGMAYVCHWNRLFEEETEDTEEDGE